MSALVSAGDDPPSYSDPYEGGDMEVGTTVYSTSERNEDTVTANAAGYRIVFMWMYAANDATVTGYSNNAVFQTFSTLALFAFNALFM